MAYPVKVLALASVWSLLLATQFSYADAMQLECAHKTQIATKLLGGMSEVEVRWKGVFDTADLNREGALYEYTLIGYDVAAEVKTRSIEKWVRDMAIGDTFAYPMSATATTLVLQKYLWPRGYSQPIGERTMLVSRSDLTYQVEGDKFAGPGVCELTKFAKGNQF